MDEKLYVCNMEDECRHPRCNLRHRHTHKAGGYVMCGMSKCTVLPNATRVCVPINEKYIDLWEMWKVIK